MNYLSHPGKLLVDHIGRIAAFDDDLLFRAAARYHDVGKTTDIFQRYIASPGCETSEPHALVSGIVFLLAQNGAFPLPELLFIYNAIISHHGPLRSAKTLSEGLADLGSLKMRQCAEQLRHIFVKEDARNFFAIPSDQLGSVEEFGFEFDELSFTPEQYVEQKLLYSRLIYADKYEAIFSETPVRKAFEFSIGRLNAYKEERLKPDAMRQSARDAIFKRFEAAAHEVIYTVTAPTGIGKTLVSLELALEIARRRRHTKVIYAIPFTSIIDQTAAVFNAVYPERITVHHHKADYAGGDEEAQNKTYDRMKFLVESWSEPFIVTTFYQLFFALFSNANSDNVKFQSLCNSVVVLDEVQAIPFPLWKVMQTLFPLLAERLNMTFVLMSATLPIVTRNAVELSDKERLYAEKNRYRLERLRLDSEDSDTGLQRLCDAVLQHFEQGESVLCVLNTIRNAKRLFALVEAQIGASAYCLNSYMLPKDRTETIEALTGREGNQVHHKVLISTQVIEAGVDLDFDVGFRELSPLSSIFQTAGRVNREGRKPLSTLFVFDAFDIKVTRLIYDGVLITPTENYLMCRLDERPLDECEILGFIEKYFATLDVSVSDREKMLEAIGRFDFGAVDASLNKIFNTDNDYIVSVVIGSDLQKMEEDYYTRAKVLDKWELKSFKERCFKSLSNSIVNIKSRDLEACGINVPESGLFGLRYIVEAEGIYSSRSGFLIGTEKPESSYFE